VKQVERSKTVWFGIALILLDLIPQVQEQLATLFPEFFAQYGGAIVGVLVIILRLVTRQPVAMRRASP
jgi:hypothetical protein